MPEAGRLLARYARPPICHVPSRDCHVSRKADMATWAKSHAPPCHPDALRQVPADQRGNSVSRSRRFAACLFRDTLYIHSSTHMCNIETTKYKQCVQVLVLLDMIGAHPWAILWCTSTSTSSPGCRLLTDRVPCFLSRNTYEK